MKKGKNPDVAEPSQVAPEHHKHVEARYTEQSLPEYRGNEFIEALGPVLTSKQLAATMSNRPLYDAAERTHSATNRKSMVLRLSRVYEPLAQQHAIAQKLSEMIRGGYVHRSPSKPEFNRYLQESYEQRFDGKLDEPAPDIAPMCDSYSIIGVSGVGKSRLTKRALAQFPSLIWHPTLRRYQIPYIIVECPHNGTVKQLILNFFAELDKVAYTDYEQRFQRRKLNTEELIREVNAAAHLFGIGLIVIDEIQHARVANGSASQKLFMNFIVRFVNTSTAPVVLIGTMSSLSMLMSDFRQARRGLGAVLTNYKEGEEWDSFIQAIWRYQWTKIECPLTPELSEVMYRRTQGVPALAIKLYQFAQVRAIECRAEELTEELIDTVADEELTRVAPMVEALASGNMAKLVKYGDLALPEELYHASLASNDEETFSLADLFEKFKRQ
jgi:hypothetical protein